MTLKMVLESIEGLDDETRKLYLERDGKFHLDVEGHVNPEHEDNRIPRSRLNQEIEKRRAAEGELKTLADSLKADIPEEFQPLIPGLPPGQQIKWLRDAITRGLFDQKPADSIDSKRPGEKPPQNFDAMTPTQIMATGYKTK